MKKLFVLLTIGLALVPLSPAATKLKPGFSFGLKAGLNISDYSGADVDADFETKLGFVAGGFLTIRLGDVFAIQPEILYSQKGSKISTLAGGNMINETHSLNYIEIPLLFKIYPPLESDLRAVFFAGPYLGLKSSFKDTWTWGDQSGNEDITTFRSKEYGITAGGGLEFPLTGGIRMSAEIRYTRGITTLDVDTSQKAYNAVFAILVGISFGN